jgi:hypothetical protein
MVVTDVVRWSYCDLLFDTVASELTTAVELFNASDGVIFIDVLTFSLVSVVHAHA